MFMRGSCIGDLGLDWLFVGSRRLLICEGAVSTHLLRKGQMGYIISSTDQMGEIKKYLGKTKLVKICS